MAEPTHRCPWCSALYASKRGLAKHAIGDRCPQRYLGRLLMERAARQRGPAKRPAADELKALFERLERGE